ncbi:UDP-N-acetylmuramoyl-tripeptide--D-alanyl-D-alanine ligase [Candidatus Sumerlaeota bacterium]|nr:UDP-N-acetylmuramoyl-tripeptide--D-alanyl-D-alanine ligase [Candidatus Sumerlaeota bacterium]
MKLTHHDLVEALGIEPSLALSGEIPGVSTDSRTLQPGEIFVVLWGENFDGHDYCEAAVERGASGLIISNPFVEEKFSGRLPVFLVEDTLDALGNIAANWRERFNPLMATITGSCGKTTTKDMIAHVASRRFNTLYTQGNFNNRVGLPLTLFQLNKAHTHAMLELGMNMPGELAALTRIADPQGLVLTNINVVHCGNFEAVEDIRDAKAEMFLNAPHAEWCVLNADCPHTPWLLDQVVPEHMRVITFGENPHADVRLESATPLAPLGYAFTLRAGDQTTQGSLPLFGRANLLNAACAAAVLLQWGVPLQETLDALADFQPSKLRSTLIEADGRRIIADCYNSSPVALADALRSFAELETSGRRIAVLGDMLELGAESERFHREAGRLLNELPIDALIAVGPHAHWIGEEFTGGTHYFDDSASAAAEIKGFVSRGDLALIKGSRGMALERIVEALSAD